MLVAAGALPFEDALRLARRRGELIVPHGSTMLQLGDRLTILGDNDWSRETKAWLEGRTSHLDTHSFPDMGVR